MSKKLQVRFKNEIILADLRRLVKEKYGSYHGTMALETEAALIKHFHDEGLSGYEDISIPVKQSNTPISQKTITHTKFGKKDQILIDYLYTHVVEGENIPFEALRKIMVSECGLTSKAAHKRHITLLLAKGILYEPLDSEGDYSFYKIVKSDLKPHVSPEIIIKEDSN